MDALFSASQWIAWLGATLVAALTLTGYVFGNFETKVESRDTRETIEKRLDRMETKLDETILFIRRSK